MKYEGKLEAIVTHFKDNFVKFSKTFGKFGINFGKIWRKRG